MYIVNLYNHQYVEREHYFVTFKKVISHIFQYAVTEKHLQHFFSQIISYCHNENQKHEIELQNIPHYGKIISFHYILIVVFTHLLFSILLFGFKKDFNEFI